MAPPFIQGLSVSSTRALASVTADGRLFVGLGGLKSQNTTVSKRQKKWEGLAADSTLAESVASGPLIAG